MTDLFKNWQFQGTRLCNALREWEAQGFILETPEHKKILELMEVAKAAVVRDEWPWWKRLFYKFKK